MASTPRVAATLAFDPVRSHGNHNFWFTVSTHSNFVMRRDQTFVFRGDDDVWVFFNNKLVIDIGGVHPTVEKSIASNTLIDHHGLSEADAMRFVQKAAMDKRRPVRDVAGDVLEGRLAP